MSLDLPGTHIAGAVVIQGDLPVPPIDDDQHHHDAEQGLPAPPIPADADLRNIPEMPVNVAKVIAFAKTVTPQAFCAAMVLRCTAWHQVPAGTLPDDDAALAAMTGLDLDAWMSIREQALCGWIRCKNSKNSELLCHPEAMQKALAALEEIAQIEERRANDAARQRRCYERKKLARENGNSHAEPHSNGAAASSNGT